MTKADGRLNVRDFIYDPWRGVYHNRSTRQEFTADQLDAICSPFEVDGILLKPSVFVRLMSGHSRERN